MRWCSNSRLGVAAILKGDGAAVVAVVSEMAATEPQVNGGAPREAGEGEGAESTNV